MSARPRSLERLPETQGRTPVRRHRLSAAIVLLLVVGACAQTGSWQNPNVTQDQWSIDRTDCQDRARDQAEREYALNQQTERPLNYDLGGQWASDMNRYSAQQRQQQLFQTCMTQRGYRLVPATE